MDAEEPIACSLGEEEYRNRLDAVRHPGELALLGTKDSADGAVLLFRNTDRVRDQLTSIIEAEEACCPFLALSVHVSNDELALTVTAPPEALPIVRELVVSFQGGEGTLLKEEHRVDREMEP